MTYNSLEGGDEATSHQLVGKLLSQHLLETRLAKLPGSKIGDRRRP